MSKKFKQISVSINKWGHTTVVGLDIKGQVWIIDNDKVKDWEKVEESFKKES